MNGHVPVLIDSVMDVLQCRPGGIYVDGTLGGAGYAREIVRSIGTEGVLLALDWDGDALIRGRERLRDYQDRIIFRKACFSELGAILDELSLGPVDGIALDLGVSSFQLDDPQRGFSFQREGPLDMRMDGDLPYTAADLVNTLQEKELARLIFELGEERWAKRIARAIVSQRVALPFVTTIQLAELIRGIVPKSADDRRIHPATRTFQALRIAVNRELDALGDFLDGVLALLKPGGRLCVVAFHSLEDRMVKERMKYWARSCRCPSHVLQCACEGKPLVKLLTRKAVKAGSAEVDRNPRSRSARLRGMEKL